MWRRFRQILVFDRWDGLLGVAEGVLHLVKGLGEPLLWPQMPQKRNPLLPSWWWCDRSQWGRSCCWCLRNFFRLQSLDIYWLPRLERRRLAGTGGLPFGVGLLLVGMIQSASEAVCFYFFIRTIAARTVTFGQSMWICHCSVSCSMFSVPNKWV